ncbi:unnamed protein product, partial [Vitis vinifera]
MRISPEAKDAYTQSASPKRSKNAFLIDFLYPAPFSDTSILKKKHAERKINNPRLTPSLFSPQFNHPDK